MAENEDGSTLVVDVGDSWKAASEDLNGGDGFGYIGKVRIAFGYKAFVPKMSNEESFFEFIYKDAASEKLAREKAQELIVKHDLRTDEGEYKKPSSAFAIHLYKSGVLSKDASAWVADKWWVFPLWTPNWKIIVLPALEKLKLKVGNQDVWGLIRFKADPSGKTHEGKDAEGNVVQQPDLVFYLAAVYASEAEAKTHCKKKEDAPASSDGKPTFPKGYTEATWNELATEIKQAYTESKSNTAPEDFKSGEVIKSLSEVYGLVESWVRKAIGLKE